MQEETSGFCRPVIRLEDALSIPKSGHALSPQVLEPGSVVRPPPAPVGVIGDQRAPRVDRAEAYPCYATSYVSNYGQRGADIDLGFARANPSARGLKELPSAGSAGHAFGTCKPCGFFYAKGCLNGTACSFCHLCDRGEKKRRQKQKKASLKGGA